MMYNEISVNGNNKFCSTEITDITETLLKVTINTYNLSLNGGVNMAVDLHLCIQCFTCTITNKTMSLIPTNDRLYSMQHYVIKLVNNLWHTGGILWVLWILPPLK